MDSLAHIFDDGVTYNGYAPTDELMLSTGPQRGGVDVMRTGIMTRGILMDIPRLKGVEYLEPGTRIFPEDLEAWEAQAGVRVSAGDALFVRIGRWARRAEVGPWSVHQEVAGLDPSCIPWLRERDVALLGSESSMDVAPPPGDLGRLVLHNFALVYLGIPVLDNMDLTAVSAGGGRTESLGIRSDVLAADRARRDRRGGQSDSDVLTARGEGTAAFERPCNPPEPGTGA